MPSPSTSARDKWVAGTGLLLQLHDDPLAIVKALRDQRWFDLAAAVEIAGSEVDPTFALTDPAFYRAIRDAITLFHLKGFGVFDLEKLKAKAGL